MKKTITFFFFLAVFFCYFATPDYTQIWDMDQRVLLLCLAQIIFSIYVGNDLGGLIHIKGIGGYKPLNKIAKYLNIICLIFMLVVAIFNPFDDFGQVGFAAFLSLALSTIFVVFLIGHNSDHISDFD